MSRRRFLHHLAALGLGTALPSRVGALGGRPSLRSAKGRDDSGQEKTGELKLFLAGDVMTGRGLDQVLAHPVDPVLYEPYVKDARDYVRLAEAANGKIDKPVPFNYVWGPVPGILEDEGVDLRIVNLETAVTDHDEPWPAKGINYRMHPRNAPVLKALGLDCCVLANNHVLDWREPGLEETLLTLREQGMSSAGAGGNIDTAKAPASFEINKGRRLLVFAFATPSSGVPAEWAAKSNVPGVNFLPNLDQRILARVKELISEYRQSGDIVLVSIHWGANWGYEVSPTERRFAHGLVDEAGVDLLHGHSSHHPRGIEVHSGRLILYGCGDFLNDYEGITGHEHFRPDLVAMYLPTVESSGALSSLDVVPMRIARMQLNPVPPDDARWLAATLNEHAPGPGARLHVDKESRTAGGSPVLRLDW